MYLPLFVGFCVGLCFGMQEMNAILEGSWNHEYFGSLAK